MCETKIRNAEEAELSDEELLERPDLVNEEYFPAEVVDRLLAKENPVTVYREYRGMSLAELAKAAGIGENELAEMESGSRAVPACGCEGAWARIRRSCLIRRCVPRVIRMSTSRPLDNHESLQ